MEGGSLSTIDDVLRAAGVTPSTLTDEQRRALDQRGFVVFRGVLDADALATLRAAFELVAAEPREDGRVDGGTRHPNDLVRRAAAFEVAVSEPRVLAAAHHVLGRDFRVSQLSGRDPTPGFGRQALHTDWLPRETGEPAHVVTAIWMLDDFTPKNGATRVVPGTHRLFRMIPRRFTAPDGHHPDEEFVVGEAGAVLVFNGHLWHSGTRNDSRSTRRALQCVFAARESVLPDDDPAPLPDALGDVARFLMA